MLVVIISIFEKNVLILSRVMITVIILVVVMDRNNNDNKFLKQNVFIMV